MGKGCSFRYYVFLKDVTDELLKCMRIAYPWDATKFTPKFTGAQPHVMLMDEMEGLRHNFYALRVYTKDDLQ